MLLSTGVISDKLPQAFASGKWSDDFNVICPLVDEEGRKEVMKRLAECRRLALDTLARMLPDEFQAKPIDLMIPGISPVLPRCTPGLTWIIEDEAIEAEMSRQECSEVDMLFCLKWHWHAFGQSVHPGQILCMNSCGILCTNLRTYGKSTCSRSERALKTLVLFTFLECIGFITPADGSSTLFQSILKDVPKTLQESCLLALIMIQEGFIDNSWGYGFQTWGSENNLANPKLMFQRIISLTPVTLSSNSKGSGEDDSALSRDIKRFHSLAKEIASSLQQLMQAASASVLLADDSRTDLVPRQPDLASWLPEFAVPTTPISFLADFCLQYRGSKEDFSNMTAKDPSLQQDLEQMNVAADFWKQTCSCIRALDADMDVPKSFMAALREADDWVHQQKERLDLKFF
jgi:hypothetical protein